LLAESVGVLGWPSGAAVHPPTLLRFLGLKDPSLARCRAASASFSSRSTRPVLSVPVGSAAGPTARPVLPGEHAPSWCVSVAGGVFRPCSALAGPPAPGTASAAQCCRRANRRAPSRARHTAAFGRGESGWDPRGRGVTLLGTPRGSVPLRISALCVPHTMGPNAALWVWHLHGLPPRALCGGF